MARYSSEYACNATSRIRCLRPSIRHYIAPVLKSRKSRDRRRMNGTCAAELSLAYTQIFLPRSLFWLPAQPRAFRGCQVLNVVFVFVSIGQEWPRLYSGCRHDSKSAHRAHPCPPVPREVGGVAVSPQPPCCCFPG